jgi:hypothetical protein
MTGGNPLAGLMTPGGDRASLVHALAEASAAMARLDQALASHPLRQAVLHRSRLEAVRRQAAVDGHRIDPWHLAATLEGLRLRMDPHLRIVDRGRIIDAARAALALHQWIVAPDREQEGEVRRAEAILADQPASLPPLLAAAQGFRIWIESGGRRAPLRSALIRSWCRCHLLRIPMPLTGAAALRAEQPWEPGEWTPAFLKALATEAEDGLDLLHALERAWFEARHGVARRRKTSRAGMAVDVLAAVPVISATSLAGILGIAVKNATRILDELLAAGIAIEVTHRSKRRLFGLRGLTPLREVVRPPYRPDPELGRGRPRRAIEVTRPDTPPVPLPPLTPIERRAFDYTALEEAMAHLDAVIRTSRFALRSGS